MLLGLGVGVGFVFKYTILMLVPGLLVFALVARGQLAPMRRVVPGALIALVIGAVGFIPVVVWNAQNDWGTVRHLMGHLGLQGGDMPVGAVGGCVSPPPLWVIAVTVLDTAEVFPAASAARTW